VIDLVRFNEFSNERRLSSLTFLGEAHGLLRELSEASAAVDQIFWRGVVLIGL
jgi:hypothetical protein